MGRQCRVDCICWEFLPPARSLQEKSSQTGWFLQQCRSWVAAKVAAKGPWVTIQADGWTGWITTIYCIHDYCGWKVYYDLTCASPLWQTGLVGWCHWSVQSVLGQGRGLSYGWHKCTRGDPDPYLQVYRLTESTPDLVRSSAWVTRLCRSSTWEKDRYLSWIWVKWVLAGTYKYPRYSWVSLKMAAPKHDILRHDYGYLHRSIIIFGSLALLLEDCNDLVTRTAPGKSHQSPSTEAACVLSSDKEWRIFETGKTPRREGVLNISWGSW